MPLAGTDEGMCPLETSSEQVRPLPHYEKARHQLGVTAERQNHYYDVRTKDRQFQVGDFVLRFYHPNLRNKLNPPFIGLFRVMGKHGEVTCCIQKTSTSKSLIVHVDHLKMFHSAKIPEAWASVSDASGQPQAVALVGDKIGEGDNGYMSDDGASEPEGLDGEFDSSAPTDPHDDTPNSPQQSYRPSKRRRCLPAHFRNFVM